MLSKTTGTDYRTQLQEKLPRGPAWSRELNSTLTLLLDGLAEELSRAHNSAVDLIAEMNPLTTLVLLPVWESLCGLPDTCSAGYATTIQERRAAVINKLNETGGQSPQYFKDLATRLGYSIELTERKPFICGKSQCGKDSLTGGAISRYRWNVKVLGPRVTYFRAGASQCGVDPLAKITRAEDLECIFKRIKPAQTELIFGYEGV
ncbi:MAG: putative phage tail protein [Halopseudomonas aestusnigri]